MLSVISSFLSTAFSKRSISRLKCSAGLAIAPLTIRLPIIIEPSSRLFTPLPIFICGQTLGKAVLLEIEPSLGQEQQSGSSVMMHGIFR